MDFSFEQLGHAVEAMPSAMAVLEAIRGDDGRIIAFRTTYANAAARCFQRASAAGDLATSLCAASSGSKGTDYFSVLSDVVDNCRIVHSEFRLEGDSPAVFYAVCSKNDDGVLLVWQPASGSGESWLRNAVRAAEEASRVKSAFLATMSHEIRTPLNGVLGFAELALYDDSLNQTVREYLEKIQLSANSLLDIVNNVLDLTGLGGGHFELNNQPFVLHDIFSYCDAVIGPRAAEKGLMLYFYAEPNLSRRISGDMGKLRQVLMNLLSNAVKFTNVGVVKLMADLVEVRPGRAAVRFEVKDSGVGMGEEDIARLFSPNIRLDKGMSRRYDGTGLGHAISKRLIEMMGGTLQVESALGIGSKFSFELEFELLDPVGVSERTPRPPPLDCVRPTFCATALVCEDNDINQEVILEHLSRVGIHATIVGNGRAGVKAALEARDRGEPFDIILMDIHMPVLDGLDATREMLAAGIETPIVALTANVLYNSRESYLRHGMKDFLAKPFSATELWECLLRHLEPVSLAPVPVEEQNAIDNVTPADGELRLRGLIDRSVGLERAAGNADLYQRLLRNFARDNQDLWNRLNTALQVGDIKLAHRISHTLKSISGTIGALNLAEAAYAVEKALADGNRSRLTPETLQAMGDALSAVLSELSPLLVSGATEIRLRKAPVELDEAKARGLADRLRPLLISASTDSQELLPEIGEVFAPLREQCNRLTNHIDDFEFEEALAELDVIEAILSSQK